MSKRDEAKTTVGGRQNKLLRYVDLMVKRIPRDLRDHFKVLCFRQGTNMSARLVKFMQETVKEDAQRERRAKGET